MLQILLLSCQNVTFVTESKQLTLMKSTLEGIQPADGEVRVADGLHQRQLGLHTGECVEAAFWLEVRLARQSSGGSL